MSDMKKIITQKKLDEILQKQGGYVLRILAQTCDDTEDGTYYLCSLMHDSMKMFYSILSRNLDSQQAKAAFKVAIDSVLLEKGMSVQIHEFS